MQFFWFNEGAVVLNIQGKNDYDIATGMGSPSLWNGAQAGTCEVTWFLFFSRPDAAISSDQLVCQPMDQT